jgi:hypothetical protein
MSLSIFTIFRSVIGREEQQLTRLSKSATVGTVLIKNWNGGSTWGNLLCHKWGKLLWR